MENVKPKCPFCNSENLQSRTLDETTILIICHKGHVLSAMPYISTNEVLNTLKKEINDLKGTLKR